MRSINSSQLLAHLTEMIRAARSRTMLTAAEPIPRARALVAILGGPAAECKAVTIERPDKSVIETFYVIGEGIRRVVLTQMGNVPIVLVAVRLGARSYLRGPAIEAEFSLPIETTPLELVLTFQALWWPRGIN